MPTLFRFFMIICVVAALVYAAMYALVVLVEPNQAELTVPVEVPGNDGVTP
ncbi:hypothetical protein [Arvimicrobium flavum]|uniref:hypothetical protein n=1 Tax=Arvimicrobium flavum TaxID=3393320 RepID=UPI00237BAF27|nr:hypothetical protein [Mesorhizobium shangrilense]